MKMITYQIMNELVRRYGPATRNALFSKSDFWSFANMDKSQVPVVIYLAARDNDRYVFVSTYKSAMRIDFCNFFNTLDCLPVKHVT